MTKTPFYTNSLLLLIKNEHATESTESFYQITEQQKLINRTDASLSQDSLFLTSELSICDSVNNSSFLGKFCIKLLRNLYTVFHKKNQLICCEQGSFHRFFEAIDRVLLFSLLIFLTNSCKIIELQMLKSIQGKMQDVVNYKSHT